MAFLNSFLVFFLPLQDEGNPDDEPLLEDYAGLDAAAALAADAAIAPAAAPEVLPGPWIPGMCDPVGQPRNAFFPG